MRFIGIDPGQAGGLVMLSQNGQPLEARGMPEQEEQIWTLLHSWRSRPEDGVCAYLEKVRSSPQMSKGSIFVFGWGYGGLRMGLIAAGIPFVEVAPQKWQKFLGVRDKTGARPLEDVNKTEKKNRHKVKAAELFPTLSMTHKLADAALIAEYGRRIERGFGAELPVS
jgi:hypothetical protein